MTNPEPYSAVRKFSIQQSAVYLSLVLLGAGGFMVGNRMLANPNPAAAQPSAFRLAEAVSPMG